jgi:hypothetical protein
MDGIGMYFMYISAFVKGKTSTYHLCGWLNASLLAETCFASQAFSSLKTYLQVWLAAGLPP